MVQEWALVSGLVSSCYKKFIKVKSFLTVGTSNISDVHRNPYFPFISIKVFLLLIPSNGVRLDGSFLPISFKKFAFL